MCYHCGKVSPGSGPRLLLVDEGDFVYRVGPKGSTATAVDNGKWERLEAWPGFTPEFFRIKGVVNPNWIKWHLKVKTKKIQRRINRGGYIDPFLLEDAGLDKNGDKI